MVNEWASQPIGYNISNPMLRRVFYEKQGEELGPPPVIHMPPERTSNKQWKDSHQRPRLSILVSALDQNDHARSAPYGAGHYLSPPRLYTLGFTSRHQAAATLPILCRSREGCIDGLPRRAQCETFLSSLPV